MTSGPILIPILGEPAVNCFPGELIERQAVLASSVGSQMYFGALSSHFFGCCFLARAAASSSETGTTWSRKASCSASAITSLVKETRVLMLPSCEGVAAQPAPLKTILANKKSLS